MPRIDVAPDDRLLLRLLRNPCELAGLSAQEMSRALDAAESARLLGWFVSHLPQRSCPGDAPPWLHERLVHAERLIAEYDRAVEWEIVRLRRALNESGITWVLLKGGGYLAANLPNGHGRRVADLDVLVPEADLPRAERLLRQHGWEFPPLDPYDERYYRQWMHELPPMIHQYRGAVVDLHHALLPRTSRLHPSTDRLMQRLVEVAPGVRVLCPSHMVLHAAAHLFHDGEIAGAIRDLIDVDSMLRFFTRDPTFWEDLIGEASALGLTRPLYYALRYARRILGTPIPAEVVDASAPWGPTAVVRFLMDTLVERTLRGRASRGSDGSAFALYVRSHWLRMPPLLLVPHLLRKVTRSA